MFESRSFPAAVWFRPVNQAPVAYAMRPETSRRRRFLRRRWSTLTCCS